MRVIAVKICGGASSAAPAPWTTRAVVSIPIDDAAHTTPTTR